CLVPTVATALSLALAPVAAVAALPGGTADASTIGVQNADVNAVSGSVVTTTQHEGRYVALTFDDGPSAEWTPQVLDILYAEQVKATFCLVGEQVTKFPALVRRIVAEGHKLCSHSWRHDDLSAETPEEIRADLTVTSEAIRAAVPDAAIPYFRAPYGGWG